MLAYERIGRGSPLVLIHGVGHDRSAWRPVLTELSDQRELIALDLPGHGASSPLATDRAYTVEAYADAVRGAINDLGLERPHVAGNSLGGAIALELARSGDARSATALAPIGFWSPAEIRFTMASLRSTRALNRALRPLIPALLGHPWARAVLLAQFYGRPARLSPADARAAAEAFATSTALPVTLPHTRNYRFTAEPPISVPVTIAWGTRDRLLLPRQARHAQAILPSATHVRLNGCGHVPMSDDPQKVAATLLHGSKTSP
ncbi:alpha/beta fold hydrolase [Actinomadura rudentiformis]|uniref:Alpha/beta fold hydrolase n=1 Tax=Actinomadura rudentiformis TaxID=359158 RepID=A0A6H9ZCF0_9ACTN|nr:alpha/beta fold hydrolase [Actinomadura rudentiformis]KAB2352229.1 alpha/beta fold hydrolase [Actinomadura rudentiformis]